MKSDNSPKRNVTQTASNFTKPFSKLPLMQKITRLVAKIFPAHPGGECWKL